jgi:hypothetical protein
MLVMMTLLLNLSIVRSRHQQCRNELLEGNCRTRTERSLIQLWDMKSTISVHVVKQQTAMPIEANAPPLRPGRSSYMSRIKYHTRS